MKLKVQDLGVLENDPTKFGSDWVGGPEETC